MDLSSINKIVIISDNVILYKPVKVIFESYTEPTFFISVHPEDLKDLVSFFESRSFWIERKRNKISILVLILITSPIWVMLILGVLSEFGIVK